MSGYGGTNDDVPGPTCIFGQTYCTKTTGPPFFDGAVSSPSYGSCETPPSGTSTACARTPTCQCLCGSGNCCAGRFFASCDDSNGVVTVFCGGQ